MRPPPPPPPPPTNNSKPPPPIPTSPPISNHSRPTNITTNEKQHPPPPPIPTSNQQQPPPIPISTTGTTSPLAKSSLADKILDHQVRAKNLLIGRTKSQRIVDDAKDANPFGRGSSLNEYPHDSEGLDAGFPSNNGDDSSFVFHNSTYDKNQAEESTIKNNTIQSTTLKLNGRKSALPTNDTTGVVINHDIKKLDIEGPKDTNIYHKLNFPTEWIYIAIIVHFIQFGILLDLAYDVLSKQLYYFLLGLAILVGLLLLIARFTIKKKPLKKLSFFMEELKPEDEVDEASDLTLILLALASILEGFLFALFCSFCVGKTSSAAGTAVSKVSLLSALQYSSITFLAFHRTVRPSNRCDPLRTMMELDVVSVCWDALDGSTFFQLLELNNNFSYAMDMSIRFLMSFWYVSVGFRVCIMHLALCSPESIINRLILTPVLSLSEVPTVDRTLQGLRFRSTIVVTMTFAELYAIIVRFTLWSKGKLDYLQQEMAIKNVIFLCSVYGAYDMYQSTKYHNWNTRDLGIGYNLKLPRRHFQMKFFKYTFVIFYLLEGSLLGSVLLKSADSNSWVINVGTDLLLVTLFLFYCRKCYNHRVQPPRFFLLPQPHFIIYPYYLPIIFSFLMAGNLFIVR